MLLWIISLNPVTGSIQSRVDIHVVLDFENNSFFSQITSMGYYEVI